MRTLANWIQTPAARAVGWTLFHFLWEGIAIAAVLAALLAFLKSSRARYAAACLALVAMLAACGITFLRVLPAQAHGPWIGPLRLPPQPETGAGDIARGIGLRPEDLLPWAAPIWLAGALFLHIRTLVGWLAARRLRDSGVCPASAEWQERLRRLAARVRLSAPVALLESCRVDVPLVLGYLRPVILVPVGLLAGMPPAHLEAILLHELAHIRRRDYLVNLLQTVAENLLFYHPAVWWISGVIRAERENCCDDLVIAVQGNALDYAAALTALEESRWTGEPALAATGGNLMKRIRRILDHPEPPHAALRPGLTAALVVVTAAVALAAWQPTPQGPAPQADMTPYQKWLTQDVAYIITDAERAAFRQLGTDEEREHFIEQFWARRDPTPGTPINEMKEEHYRRIAYTNQKYSDPSGLAGWKTDRGRIYITYGPPDEIESHPNGSPGSPTPYEEWLYHHVDGIGDNVIVRFILEDGKYHMTLDPNMPPWIPQSSIWPDVVKRGEMRRQVRGLGALAYGGTAEVKIAETQMRDVRLGQVAALDIDHAIVSGRVSRIDPGVSNGTVNVTIALDAPAPAAAQPGQRLDATVNIEVLPDAVYVGRPVFAQPNSDGAIFKLEGDGRHAVKVPVRFGRTSVNQIEIVGGLIPGDRVILSDMTRWMRYDRIEIR